MKTLRIGGVPEHFNLPWHRLVQTGRPRAAGIDVQWRDYADGSGAMAAALDSEELDVAMLLTESAVAGVAGGGRYSIVSAYTESPLIWGIHVPFASDLREETDVRGRRYAISRRGSGSHLMCCVHAQRHGWPVDTLEFVVVRNLNGAIAAFETGQADVFFWEKFMTKPLVDAGRFRRVADLVAPWPAFVVCASHAALAGHGAAIAELLNGVFAAAADLAHAPGSAAEIGARYGLATDDAAEWLRVTRWARAIAIDRDVVETAATTLARVGAIDARFDASTAVATLGAS